MVTTSITTESILAYQAYLHSEERSASTIENYLRHVRALQPGSARSLNR